MLTKLTIRNFKRFGEVEVDLGNPVVFIGPNNSGKTSAIQALALWDIGVKRWNEKRKGKGASARRSGVTVNRKDMFAIPHPSAKDLWRNLHVRDVQQVEGRTKTNNVRIDLIVQGVTEDSVWTCGLEFDYANEESFYCRPLRCREGKSPERMPIPEQAGSVDIVFLPPMSGLAATETRLDKGAVNVRVGEGRTAEVLRNLCFRVMEESEDKWQELVKRIEQLFGVELEMPRYVPERGEITMGYREQGLVLDISSSGRGLQQTLLILVYMYANPQSVILLDEPDAHLEILRQQQIYALLIKTARENGNQIIAASHSEVLLNEAAGKDMVVAFVGKPNRIDSQGSRMLKALKIIGYDHYYQAELTGWVLYLEGSTDLAILQALAERLGSTAVKALERPFVQYVDNQPKKAEDHYFGLREALPDLAGIVLFDRLEQSPPNNPFLRCLTWKKREIENYLCTQATLEHYARASGEAAAPETGPLFAESEAEARCSAMREAITMVSGALETLDKGSPWSGDIKASDDFLKPLFAEYFKRLKLPNLMEKKDYYELAQYIPKDEIDPEIGEKLNAIAEVAGKAKSADDK